MRETRIYWLNVVSNSGKYRKLNKEQFITEAENLGQVSTVENFMKNLSSGEIQTKHGLSFTAVNVKTNSKPLIKSLYEQIVTNVQLARFDDVLSIGNTLIKNTELEVLSIHTDDLSDEGTDDRVVVDLKHKGFDNLYCDLYFIKDRCGRMVITEIDLVDE